MQFPQINLNGTDGKVLLEEYSAAMRAVLIAKDTLAKVTCHGRDYQTIGSNAASVAYAEHCARLRKLEHVLNDLTSITVEIQRQVEERRAR